MGHSGYGTACYYSVEEDEGKRIEAKMKRSAKDNKIKNYKWSELPDEKLDAVIAILEG